MNSCIFLKSYIFVNSNICAEIYKFKGKNSEINTFQLFLGNFSKYFSVDNIKTTGLHRCFHDSWVNSGSINGDDVWIFINEKTQYKKMFRFIKKCLLGY